MYVRNMGRLFTGCTVQHLSAVLPSFYSVSGELFMYTDHQDFLNQYARIVVTAGVSLYPGQKLNITTGYRNYEFACTLADAAYRAGASYVGIDVISNLLTRVRAMHSDERFLDYVPEFASQKYAQMCAEDWAFIRIDDTEELDVLSGVPVQKLGELEKAARRSKHIYYKNLLGNRITWCVICAPGPEWSRHVTGSDDMEELFSILAPVLRIDRDDPPAAWETHGERLEERRAKLNALRIHSLHITSEETDLTVYLTPTSEWHGGPSYTLDGRKFMANIPTEEVFTTPDYTKTSGTVKVTRPLKVLESTVEGARFTFRDGKVVEYSADRGADILEQYLSIDPGASFLGEVALVSRDSPLAESGRLFGSILYDENASSHIALGSGYPSCLSNMLKLHGDEELRNAGCNISLVHTDFMIGSGKTKVAATGIDGIVHVVMDDGLFTI